MHIDVIGTPAPQGSKHGFAIKRGGQYTGKVATVESSKKVRPWRQDVKYAALNSIALEPSFKPLAGPIFIKVFFYLPRPKGHYRTGANAHLLRDAAPPRPAGRPDWDKLLRSTFDALSEAGIWCDDAQVTDVLGGKRYADERQPGADIEVHAANVRGVVRARGVAS